MALFIEMVNDKCMNTTGPSYSQSMLHQMTKKSSKGNLQHDLCTKTKEQFNLSITITCDCLCVFIE